MKDLKQKVAVVTGGASGLGRSMALAFAREGMRVAIADVDRGGLETVAGELRALGTKVLAQRVDVSKGDQVETLASRVVAELGGVHVVCNNAGVALTAPVWDTTVADWQWTLGVNLWGVIHGIRVFVPRLIAQDEGHVVNTASVAGLISPPGSGAYGASKHAVVTLTETLYHDLQEHGSSVGVSVLCPAYVPTGIAESERHRPKEFLNPPREPSPLLRAKQAMLRKAVQTGKISADQVAQMVVAAVKANRFYIVTHPRIMGAVELRMRDILDERAPHNPLAL
ncbi:MAG TPA: SDR family NAD(P)-dependent oxidoreductase [Burkholderiales bacterium]|nr:SDR family NAD(P)-dependent oxidoreductase [Burkholderiales bacterium]